MQDGFASKTAEDTVKNTSQKVIDVLKKDRERLEANPALVYDLVEEHVLPHFDFIKMSRLALGKYWRQATRKQKLQFIEEFRLLLVRTYATAMLDFSDEEIHYLPFRNEPDAKKVVVKTEVEQGSGSPIPIDYSMYIKGDEWKVYDVRIDDVSLIVNYRSAFTSEIRKEGGVAGLINKLHERNQKVIEQTNNSNTP
ncbi:MAG: phospholipid-binding protein MlaC [Gammaproteobacteria bacterium]